MDGYKWDTRLFKELGFDIVRKPYELELLID